MDRIQESNRLRSGLRRAVGQQMSAGHLHLNGFDSRLPKTKSPPKGAFCFGAGYGSRTRLHGLGSRCITDIRILHFVRVL